MPTVSTTGQPAVVEPRSSHRVRITASSMAPRSSSPNDSMSYRSRGEPCRERDQLRIRAGGLGTRFDFDKSPKSVHGFHAGVLHAMGKTAKDAMYQHNHWSGKTARARFERAVSGNAKVEDLVDARIAEITAFLKVGLQAGPDVPVAIRDTDPHVSGVLGLRQERQQRHQEPSGGDARRDHQRPVR